MRGGKREGSGRKKAYDGERKVISLTLTADQWAQIEQSGLNPSAYIREMLDGTTAASTPIPHPEPVAPIADPLYDIKVLDDLWEHIVNIQFSNVTSELLEAARAVLDRNLPQTEVSKRYLSPFNGKRYGSMDKVIEHAIPYVIESKIAESKRKQEHARRKLAEAGPRYLDQI